MESNPSRFVEKGFNYETHDGWHDGYSPRFNDAQVISVEIVEAARDSLVIGQA
jgi:hypothetical protein